MIKKGALADGLPYSTCCHTFRATGITAYLENGGTIENAQAPPTNHRGQRNSTTARVMKLRLMKSSGLRFEPYAFQNAGHSTHSLCSGRFFGRSRYPAWKL